MTRSTVDDPIQIWKTMTEPSYAPLRRARKNQDMSSGTRGTRMKRAFLALQPKNENPTANAGNVWEENAKMIVPSIKSGKRAGL